MIDYHLLLKKYMKLVIDCESIDYLVEAGHYLSDVKFTAEELAELQKISDETNR